MEASKLRKRTPAATLLDLAIILPAIGQAVVKLDPRTLMKNPVMFVLEIVTALTTILVVRHRHRRTEHRVRTADRDLAVVHRAVREFRRGRC